MVDLGPIKEDVQFNQSDAESFASACTASATLLDDQCGDRSSWENTALEDFQGYFSEVFRENAAVRAQDATNLADSLRKTAKAVRDVAEEARKEQERRQAARDWASRHDDWWEKAWDFFFGEGDPPPQGAQAQGVTIPADAPSTGSRETPAPGSGGGSSSGYSSAKPENLRSFADSSQGADDSLRIMQRTLGGAYETFRATCKWGGVDADGVISAFGAYINANANDETWARTVADAFARAGGEGNVSTLPDAAIQAALEAANVATSREPLSIENPTTYGMKTTTGYADDPVNTATGLFVEPETDLALAGGCDGLTLSRVYNSADHAMRAFGVGWSSIADSRVCVTDEGVLWRRDDGRVVLFPRLGDGWDHASGEPLWIRAVETVDGDSRDGGGASWAITDNAGGEWRFARDGLPLAFRVAGGAWVRCIHDGAGHLVSLVHERGRAIALSWDAGRIVGADVAGDAASAMAVRYTYDDAGRLVHADRPGGKRSYGYGDNGLIATVTDADGVVEVTNTYDVHGRISTQRSPFGRTSVYSYLAGGVTVVADPDGSRANTWIADQQGRCTGIVDSNGERQSISYDQWGNPAMVTERDESTTLTAYDKRGRIVRRVTPEGADLRWTWDGQDRVTSVTTGQDAVTLFDYASPDDRNPSSITDPTGGITCLEWHDGLLKQLIDPTGVPIRFEHDRHGDLTAIIDADGNASRLEHDRFGRVTAAITPMGHRTEYTWDDNGHLAARKDPDGAIWRYGHTAAGRPTTITAPDGAVTTIEYGEHGEAIMATDALGNAKRFTYDDLGYLSSAILPDGNTWEYRHDALGRLVGLTSPDGGTWTNRYDAIGRPVESVDNFGMKRAASYDRKSRTVTITVGALSSRITYDRNGRPSDIQLSDGNRAGFSYDSQGRMIGLLDGASYSSFEYDQSGRLLGIKRNGDAIRLRYGRTGALSQVSAGGQSTFLMHDRDGRLSLALNGQESVAWQYDVCNRVIDAKRTSSNAVMAHTRIAYDKAGHVADVKTGKKAFSYHYDAAGQLTGAACSDGRLSIWSYDKCGRVLRHFTDSSDTRFTYDRNGYLSSRISGNGERTSYRYDGMGQRVFAQKSGALEQYLWDPLGHLTSIATNGDVHHMGTPWSVLPSIMEGTQSNQMAHGTDVASVFRNADGLNDSMWWRLGWHADVMNPFAVYGMEKPYIPMGIRVYDQSSCAFLSQDPLRGPLTAPWSGNPYEFAGNNPSNMSDPTGFKPITDADMLNPLYYHADNWFYSINRGMVAGIKDIFVDAFNLGKFFVGGATALVYDFGGWSKPEWVQQAADGWGNLLPSIWNAVTHPIETVTGIWDSLTQTAHDKGWGYAVGYGAAFVASCLIGAGEVKVGSVSKVEKAAGAASKLDDVSDLSKAGKAADKLDDASKASKETEKLDKVDDLSKADDAGSSGAATTVTLDAADTAKLERWREKNLHAPSDELYLEHKDVYDNPKYFDQDTGEIHWPPDNGFATEPTEIELPIGAKIDRYSLKSKYEDVSGYYFAPVDTPYEQRALAPGSDKNFYTQYEVVRPFLVEEGYTAPWFGQPGGGVQYHVKGEEISVAQLLTDGYIKPIN